MATQSDPVTGHTYETPGPAERPSDPDEIRREIERTRAELAGDVDRLADRTSPKRVVQRNVNKLGSRFSSIKESVMGSPNAGGGGLRDKAGGATDTVKDKASSAADSVQGAAQSAAGSVQSAAQSAADTVREAPHTVARQTRGNPLAVGLIAFGAGLVAASLIPSSEAEKQAGQKLADQSQGLMEKVKEPLQEMKQDVTDSARESVQQVKETAQNAAQTTKESTKETAQNTADQVRSS
jgi:uncharacterized protein YjbJ (UPF0337 family)